MTWLSPPPRLKLARALPVLLTVPLLNLMNPTVGPNALSGATVIVPAKLDIEP